MRRFAQGRVGTRQAGLGWNKTEFPCGVSPSFLLVFLRLGPNWILMECANFCINHIITSQNPGDNRIASRRDAGGGGCRSCGWLSAPTGAKTRYEGGRDCLCSAVSYCFLLSFPISFLQKLSLVMSKI